MNEKKISAICKDATELIHELKIDNGHKTFGDSLSKFYEKIYKYYCELINIHDFVSIICDNIDNELAKNNIKPKNFNGLLVNLLNKDNIQNIINNIVSTIESVPTMENYVYIFFPNLNFSNFNEVKICDNISFMEGTKDKIFLCYPLRNIINDEYRSLELYKDHIYLKIKTKGYAYNSIDSTAIQNALTILKQLLFFSFDKDIFIPSKGYFTNIMYDYPAIYFSNTIDLEKCKAICLPPDLSNYIYNIRFSDTFIKKENFQKDLWNVFSPALKIINNNDPNYEYIKSSIDWAFEASLNINETFSYIQTCIGIEAILGDDNDNESLTNLLSDRCACLIGQNKIQRKKIKETFKKIYKTRSKLVHGRKLTLSVEEKSLLSQAEAILKLLIIKEIRQL